MFYRNGGDGRFGEKTESFCLREFRVTTSYSYVEFDDDGALDIVTVPVYGNAQFYVNNRSGNNAIAFGLRDRKGNRFAIGSKVIARYGDGGPKQQMVEIQAGGGFISFDPPIAHFGLGSAERVGCVEIHWSSGEKSIIEGPFEAGSRYLPDPEFLKWPECALEPDGIVAPRSGSRVIDLSRLLVGTAIRAACRWSRLRATPASCTSSRARRESSA